MSTGTYVYCLIAAHRRPSLAGVPAGLPGTGPLRLLDVNGDRAPRSRSTRARSGKESSRAAIRQWLAVADAPLLRYGEAPINRRLLNLDWVSRAAMAHETVVESFIGAPALVPMKLFTIFTSDARALEHLRIDRPHVDRVLQRVRDHHEWGVRMILERANGPKKGTNEGSIRSGTAYLSVKKSQRDRAMQLSQEARNTTAELYERLVGCATASKRRTSSEQPVTGGPLLLDAAFLVRRSQAARFRRLVAREANSLGARGYRVTLTGPWPPYSFIQD
jgi:gas vesicle protein GvpL/GvpF